ncbi:MAG: hypothetical protein COW04_04095 [Deltaproteobacteria bacterium CG12_big_fil_rev_8_21_14_0_65_43_10]|nr:MAG: hypothetical protein AUK23_04390 [Deltaproteobacteria bacterium CG2_30_43_15]PIQ46086.1 MAG: hypothetical protein COW04_04095 [Deltaproteobacteria bacterium CG12_big_fil_rev_8_21_14_0_65_43_10]PIU86814.1 MAG: hypothetical protein COS67_00550 [Deltaproteobacteria bacterium CG06_land_8_20_14_3_00_44_19]PIZ20199.1 MAG: hypothetical protein COY50_06040 [Deltaproteobacteria bacterium CG_4_10_14_0_8_um_filter_43_12]PJB44662.1 MAG: hypothetical protein CO106_02975 [Deltaproteobacteria bacteriu
MEKIEILKKVCRLKIFRDLSTDELKLYILLLISAQELNKEEQIDLEVIRRMSGEILTIEGLKEMGFSLKKHKLASLSLSCPEEDKGRHTLDNSGQNVKLSFELYDLPYKSE